MAWQDHRDVNVWQLERVASAALGAWLAARAMRRGSTAGALLGLLGAGLLYRAATGHCEAYHAMGIDTAAARIGQQLRAWLGTRSTSEEDAAPYDPVDEASLESFPASDPPAWTPGATR